MEDGDGKRSWARGGVCKRECWCDSECLDSLRLDWGDGVCGVERASGGEGMWMVDRQFGLRIVCWVDGVRS